MRDDRKSDTSLSQEKNSISPLTTVLPMSGRYLPHMNKKELLNNDSLWNLLKIPRTLYLFSKNQVRSKSPVVNYLKM